MQLLFHYIKVISKILSSGAPYSRIALLRDYTRLVLRSIVFHKSRNIQNNITHTGTLLGNTLEFLSYPQILHLVEEIFISDIYNFVRNKSAPHIIDCGSNIGISILYFKTIYPDCHIIGFEPDPASFRLLERNIQRNKLANVTLHNVALTNTEGAVSLYINKNNAFMNMGLYQTGGSEAQQVPARKLSTFIKSQTDMLKIDVEGAEHTIINDLIQNDRIQYIRNMTIEFHPGITGISTEQFIGMLQANTFTCNVIETPLFKDAEEVIIHCRTTAQAS